MATPRRVAASRMPAASPPRNPIPPRRTPASSTLAARVAMHRHLRSPSPAPPPDPHTVRAPDPVPCADDAPSSPASPSPPFTPWNVDALAETPRRRDNDRWLKNFGIDLSGLRAAGLLPPAPLDSDTESHASAPVSDDEDDDDGLDPCIDRLAMPSSLQQENLHPNVSDSFMQSPPAAKPSPLLPVSPPGGDHDLILASPSPRSARRTPSRRTPSRRIGTPSSRPPVAKSLQLEMDAEFVRTPPSRASAAVAPSPSASVLQPLKLDTLELSHYDGAAGSKDVDDASGSKDIDDDSAAAPKTPSRAAAVPPRPPRTPSLLPSTVTPLRPPRRSLAPEEARRNRGRSRRISTRELAAVVGDRTGVSERDADAQDTKPAAAPAAGSDVLLTPVPTGARLRAQLGGSELVLTPVRRSMRLSRREGAEARPGARVDDDVGRKRLLESVGYAYAPNKNLV